VLGYAAGLLASLWLDVPSGAMIVCAIVIVGAGMALLSRGASGIPRLAPGGDHKTAAPIAMTNGDREIQ
jgi:hypothetical protein